MWYDTDEDERLILTELNDLVSVHELGWHIRSGYGIMKEYNYDYNC